MQPGDLRAGHNAGIASHSSPPIDIVIIGAGAAGLATAIFTRRLNRALRVVLVDGARRPGAKILVSGGGRCNVTNSHVTERDFNGGSRSFIRQVLRALPVAETVALFRDLGVPLHEEADGKLFPDTNRSRDVLEALLREAERTGVERLDDHRVLGLDHDDGGFTLETRQGLLAARHVVLATGGQSLPKSGSDGAGWSFAARLGHSIVPPIPALVPLVLAADSPLRHAALSGISHGVEIAVWIDGRIATRITGSLLWTHFGISGPAALDVSRHWTRAVQEGRTVRLMLNMCPGAGFEPIDAELVERTTSRPKATLHTIVSAMVPGAVAGGLLDALGLAADQPAGTLGREQRRRLSHALVEWPLPVTGTRGYNYAEVTAGGVTLAEVHARTLESKLCPGLYFVGEVLDVEGRLGGFNFQWAWASAMTAARALATTPPADQSAADSVTAGSGR